MCADPNGRRPIEQLFHDQWAASTNADELSVTPVFEGPVAIENRFVLTMMGPLAGVRLLDVGGGLGESAVYFALRGASVTYTDVSPAMAECALRLAARHAVTIDVLQVAGEDLGQLSSRFDLVYASNVLHHIHNRARFFQSMSTVLRPGGKFFTLDPLCYNPAIAVYRRMATAVRTPDESPVSFRELALARRYFSNVHHREFWIAGLALFLKYYVVDRVHPNEDRYWRRIFKETSATLWWWRPLCALDNVLTAIPVVRRFAWNMVMWGEKPEAACLTGDRDI